MFIKTIRKKKYRRSDDKIITKEGGVLKHLRESKKLSVRDVGRKVGKSGTWVSHAENGRLNLDPKKILLLLNIYNCSYQDFMKLVSGERELPQNLYAECIEILKRLDKEKLKTVRTILDSF